ncbi:MAG TPA: hypothetical protein P5084_08050, partial [Paludibacter sp.]|nr:hypothetical protein [Paludibacter sp.]
MNTLPTELTLNVLKLRFTHKKITVYLTSEATPQAVKLSEKDIAQLIKENLLQPDAKDVYARISPETPDRMSVTRAVSPEFCNESETCWSISFLKKYCTLQLTLHFKSLGFPCRNNFLSDTEVWIKAPTTYKNCTGYRVFTLRVQFNYEEKAFELLVIPGEVHSVYNHAVSHPGFSETPKESIGWVLYKTDVQMYKYLSDEARRNLNEVFPCLNPALKSQLRFTYPAPDKSNRYLKFFDEANRFKKDYLDNNALKELFEIEATWKKTTPLYFNTDKIRKLQFGKGTHTQPKYGMPQYGPVELLDEKVVFFFIGHENDKPLAATVNEYFLGKYPSEFKGIYEYLKLEYNTEQRSSIWFKDKNNPLPEIKNALKAKLENQQNDRSKRYVAIYLSPHSKYSTSPAERNIYYELKEHLLSYGIVSQALDVDKAWGKDRSLKIKTSEEKITKAQLKQGFCYSLPNIAVAIFAKLGGKPWSFEKQHTEELVIGVSAYTNRQLGKKYIGSAFSFTNEGKFHGFECFSSAQIIQLAGSIKLAVINFSKINPRVSGLVIHFYKKLSYSEIKPIQKALSELKLKIPVIVATVNKTFSDDLVGFDASTTH